MAPMRAPCRSPVIPSRPALARKQRALRSGGPGLTGMTMMPPATTVMSPHPEGCDCYLGDDRDEDAVDAWCCTSSRVRTSSILDPHVRGQFSLTSSVGFAAIDELEAGLHDAGYLPDQGLTTSLFLSLHPRSPSTRGRDQVAKPRPGRPLARARRAPDPLPVYEGLDLAHTVYKSTSGKHVAVHPPPRRPRSPRSCSARVPRPPAARRLRTSGRPADQRDRPRRTSSSAC